MRWVGLALACWAILAPVPAASAVERGAEPDPVMFITWRGCEEACEGFLDALKHSQVPVRVILRDAAQDRNRLPAFVEEARQIRPRAVVTWGNDVTLGVIGPWDAVDPARHLTDIPVVYMYVTEPVQSRIAVHEDATGRPNVAGTDYIVPLHVKLRAMSDYRRLNRLGMLYDSTQRGSVERKDAMASVAETAGVSFVARALPIGNDGRPDPAQIEAAVEHLGREGVDWIYFGFSSFLIQNVETFTAAALRQGIPLFSGGELPLLKGHGLFSVSPPLAQVGALAALQVEQILRDPGGAPGSLPIARMSRFTFLVNMRVAGELGLYPPIEMFRVLKVVR